MPKGIIVIVSIAVLSFPSFFSRSQYAREQASAQTESLPGLQRRATVVRDTFGVPHITASSDRDIYFMMGYMHAQDRFFQMDIARRQGSGTVAELLGAGPDDIFLGNDVAVRMFGVRRSAERSLSAYSHEAGT